MRKIVLAVLACFAAPAFAQAWDTTRGVVLAATNSTTVVGAAGTSAAPGSNLLTSLLQGRTYIPQQPPSSGSVLLKDLLTGPGPRGALAVTATRTVPWSAIAQGVGKALPIIGTAITISLLLESFRCKGTAGASSWSCDEGTPEVVSQVYCTPQVSGAPGDGRFCGTPAGAAEAHRAYSAPSYAQSNYGLTLNGPFQAANMSYSYSFTVRNANGSAAYNAGPFDLTQGTAAACPPWMFGGVPQPGEKGSDNLCKTGVYIPKPPDFVENKARDYGDKTKAPGIIPELDAGGIPAPHEPPVLSGPSEAPGPSIVTTGPGGTTTITTRHPITYKPAPGVGYEWGEVTTNTPPTGPPVVTTTNGPGGSTTIETCGLPGKPPCKIDETGTPEAGLPSPQQQANDVLNPWKTCVLSPSTCFPALPSLNWTFSLPSSCAPIPLPAFAPFLTQVDVCQFQPTIHDLMSLCWVGAFLFASIRMVFVDSTGGA